MNMQTKTVTHEPQVIRNLTYGKGMVGWGGRMRERVLAMDVYLPPAGASASLRPALIMAFGGAFHRGCKEDDSFEAEGGNTSVAQYCRRFAERGYVTASIDYRLVTEDPDPGDTVVVQSPEDIPVSRVAYVRELMGLPPATPQMLWRGIEAASDDMAAAIGFLHAQSREWHIDPDRVAAGGFSAGARTALNAAIGEKARVAAVVALSGFMDIRDLAHHTRKTSRGPAVLLINGTRDLDYIVANTEPLAAAIRGAGLLCLHAEVRGGGHFYRAEAPTCLVGTQVRRSVEQTIVDFLAESMPARTVAFMPGLGPDPRRLPQSGP